jgi:hypothetical protein
MKLSLMRLTKMIIHQDLNPSLNMDYRQADTISQAVKKFRASMSHHAKIFV